MVMMERVAVGGRAGAVSVGRTGMVCAVDGHVTDVDGDGVREACYVVKDGGRW